MNYIINKKYEILNKIGEGSFGKIFDAKNLTNNKMVAVKIQYKNIVNALKHEVKIYNYLNDCSFIPQIYNYGTDEGFHYIVMELLGKTLYEISLNNIDMLKNFIETLNIIEFLHNKKLIHRDIKPENFIFNKEESKLYLIDFGMTTFYMDKDKFIEEKKIEKIIGTINYCSVNIHENKLPSRRDDLESLCYTFIFCYNKQLPWQNICDENYEELVNGNKNKIHEEILLLKKNSYDFYNKLPGEFYCILNYCRKLEFNEKPNYTYLRNIINNYLQNFINI